MAAESSVLRLAAGREETTPNDHAQWRRAAAHHHTAALKSWQPFVHCSTLLGGRMGALHTIASTLRKLSASSKGAKLVRRHPYFFTDALARP
jgi:hypothetical protein